MAPFASDAAANLSHKIKFLRNRPKQWNQSTNGNVIKKKDTIKDRIQKIDKKEEDGPLDNHEKEERDHLRKQLLHDLLLQEEIIWKQRSRITWLQHGDRNTRFFHTMASFRKRRKIPYHIWNMKDRHSLMPPN